MKLNGASKITGMVIGFLGIALTIMLTFSASQSKLAVVESQMRTLDKRVDELKADADDWMKRVEKKIDDHIVVSGGLPQ